MELNDNVSVELTKEGAEVLNAYNAVFKARYGLKLKTDYVEGDIVEDQLWEFFGIFGGSHYQNCGAPVLFRNLEKVQ